MQQKNMMDQVGQIVGSLNTARSNLAGAGTQTAALASGGDTPPLQAATEEYNGSTWTAVVI
jgi:hypothetical protein